MDYFFAACEQLRNPKLNGKAVVIGTNKEDSKMKGVVQTANYEARKYGIKSGMPTKDAYKLYKDLVYLEADEPYYEKISKMIMDMLKEYDFPVEQESVDEAALDLGSIRYEKGREIGIEIKKKINDKAKLPCTVGISFGKTFAKMICESSKPDGFGIVTEKEIMDFLKAKPVKSLPGIGPKTEEKLKILKINTIGDLSNSNPLLLREKLGIAGIELYNLSNGIDKSKVVEFEEILSISREKTLNEETTDITIIKNMIKKLSKEVFEESAKKSLWFKDIGIKVRYADFTQATKSRSMNYYSSFEGDIERIGTALIKDLISKKNKKIRKVGVRISSLMKGDSQKRLIV
jgi:nucleotidyltransferase/DNA polymerase involved in DNA repair